MKKVAVIGGAGFIGSHLIGRLLDMDLEEVRVLDSFCRGSLTNIEKHLSNPRCSIVRPYVDICFKEMLVDSLKGVDTVFHLAGAWLHQCNEYPASALGVNITGTINVAEACRSTGVRRLVFSSSASVYPDQKGEEDIVEESVLSSRNVYGASKIACESILGAYYYQYGLSSIRLRYMNVYGVNQYTMDKQKPVIVSFIDSALRAEPIIIHGDGSREYDFISAEDCAIANIRAMETSADNENINIGTGCGVTLKRLASMILEITGSSSKIIYADDTNKHTVKRRVGSTAKASSILGFRASDDLYSSLERIAVWRKSLVS